MKIIFVCASVDQTDGWSRYVYDVIKQVSKSVAVAVVCNKKVPSATFPQTAVLRPALSYFINPLLVFWDLLKVRNAIKRELTGQNDVVHFTAEGYALFAPWIFGIKAKKIMTVHGTYSVLPLTKQKTRWLYQKTYRSVDRVISVSHYTKRHLLEYAGCFLAESKIRVVTNGVDFVPRDISKIERSKNDLRILSVGQVKRRKGFDHLLEVAKILKDKYNVVFRIKIVGSFDANAPFSQKLFEYVHANNLENNVEFKGKVLQQELDDAYRWANLFALLSVNENMHYEGYPLVFHEAAMWGLPVVGTHHCGAEDAIQNGKTGILVDPFDHAGTAEKIYQLWRGDIKIDPLECQVWAQSNDWGSKDLMEMYNF